MTLAGLSADDAIHFWHPFGNFSMDEIKTFPNLSLRVLNHPAKNNTAM
jgi:hypothetical protein